MITFLEYVFTQYTPQVQAFANRVYQLIRSNRFNGIPYDANISSEFYQFLTASAHGTENKKYSISTWPHDDENTTKQQQNLYLKTLSSIRSPWAKDAIPPWFYFSKITDNVDPKRQHTFKRYITLPNNNDYKLSEISKIGELVTQLNNVPSAFNLKMPLYITWLYEGIDNIIIYYQDPNDKQAVDQAIIASGIKEDNRNQFFRSNHGVDKQIHGTMKSDTQLTADYLEKKFTQYLLRKLKSLKTLPEVEAKTIIAELLLKVLKLESDHRSNYDKDPYDY